MKKSSTSLAVSLAALVCALAVTTTQAQTAESITLLCGFDSP